MNNPKLGVFADPRNPRTHRPRWRVVSGEVVVDSDHGDMLLDITQLRSMRAWAEGQRRNEMLGEGKFDAWPRLTYSESIDLVESQYPQGIRGFLADAELV